MPEGGKVSLPVVPDFGGFSSLFAGGVRGALTEAEKFGKQLGTAIGGNVQKAVALVGAGVAVALGDFILQGVSKLQKLGAQTLELQHITGASAEQASLFAGVLQHIGEDAKTAERGLAIFGSNIDKQPALFAKFGVAIAKNRDGTNDLLGTLDNLRQTLNQTADSNTKLDISRQLLGRGFLTLVGYLHLSNDQLALFQRLTREGGGQIDQKVVDQTRELSIDLQEAKDKVQAFQLQIARPVVGGLIKFFNDIPLGIAALSEAAHLDFSGLIALATGHNRAGDAARRHAQDEVDAKAALDQIGVAAAAADTALKSLSSAGEGVRSASSGLAKAQEGVATAARNTQHAVEGLAAAERGVASAHLATQHAIESRTKAEADLNKLLQKGAVDEKAVEEARRGVDSANHAVRDSTEALAAAEQHLADLQQGATADTLADARLSLRSAQLAEAQARYQLSQPSTSSDPFASQQASLSLAQATQRRKEAQEALTAAQEQGTSADKNVADAEKTVRDARERLTDATTAQADAQQKLRDAQAGDPEFDQKVADAKDAVTTATEGVAAALQGEKDAALAVRDAQQAVVDARQGQVDAASAVTEAGYKLRDANYALQDAWDKATDAGAANSRLLDELKRKYPELAGIIQQFYADIVPPPRNPFAGASTGGTISISLPNLTPAGGNGPNLSPAGRNGPNLSPVPRAGGGDVYPGQMYRINENTANSELVEFGAPGHVYTPSQAAARAGGSDQPIVIHTHIHLDGKEVATSTSRHQLAQRQALTNVRR